MLSDLVDAIFLWILHFIQSPEGLTLLATIEADFHAKITGQQAPPTPSAPAGPIGPTGPPSPVGAPMAVPFGKQSSMTGMENNI